ncbi:MAG: putative collagen-binding domain-containing protein, partial [Planctomycetota bacterium]
LGEENSQTPDQQRAMASYLRELDPYDHHIVIQTFPDEQNKVYTPLLGDQSELTGVALQNDWRVVHRQTLKWLRASSASGKPWVVCNDEQNHWTTGTPPDPGYDGYDGTDREGNVVHTVHDIRKHVLWGNLMAGGGGVEHYFGWELPQSDLLAEDWRSRAMTWNFGKIALAFFHDNEIPFWEMTNRNDLIGASDDAKTQYCLARTGGPYLVYTHGGTPMKLDLSSERGAFRVEWFNPRTGGELARGSVNRIRAGSVVSLGAPPSDADEDWLAIVRRK